MKTPMEDRFQQLRDHADTVRLTADEKGAMRSRLSAYMTMRPLRARATESFAKKTGWMFRLSPKLMPYSAAVLSLLLAGGGVSYAAEGAMPGDTLYPVKVHVNEEVRGAFTTDDEGKAAWETFRAERRLDEARTLLEEDKAVAPELLDDLEVRFAEHETRVEETITKLEENHGSEAAARISSHLETSLAAHKMILDRLSKKGTDDAKAVDEQVSDSAERVVPEEDRAERFAKKVGKAQERAGQIRERTEREVQDNDHRGRNDNHDEHSQKDE
jgi:hypothetical protein